MFGRFPSICILFCLVSISIFKFSASADERRPVYIIGHMANSIEDVIPFLDEGANVLESDIQFFPNGSVKEVYHGCPGDCFRICDKHVQLPEYLTYLRDITDPSAKNSYYNKLIMQFFDLKLDSSEDIRTSGREIARHILDYLWTDGKREREVRALIYINEVDKKDAIAGFLQEFKDRNQESRLTDIGFDGGLQDISDIQEMFQELNVSNIWLGDGTTNCFSALHPVQRLKAEINVRNSGGFIKKVYEWTIDLKFKLRSSLDLGVDGFITNVPRNLVEVLNESKYKKSFRPATVSDPPFARFQG
ncbi:dermonecrotic toxin LgSicTox-alphaIC1 [Parasteatoda tepidariorum]|uniref:dermonecrotic toxin LgSicTox-alphaIC1 n=1 Tax=Parasteatoda tepidariorum TaxID=114398 RepID=UPI001C720298|nr:dermonecrotic toxin LgSicTox-alphaIC1 [Parasteatoda tepidariorum]XP_015919393.2 dermonecrotic toxin LgSicTox-alphaIC1 [Parasteatoda tepidariorum]XP_015919394.2 dermonecrotic toxin LgSicTox-alphaIC1 [Parasteatoda tepidariorum]XP_015919398.2 dermonecrotic toxin LgSicTox-alphaIC1 [Parasteatoda tepidariorum]